MKDPLIIVRPAPTPWATPATHPRVFHQFRTNWTETRDLLVSEIQAIRLRADLDPIVMELDVLAQDIRQDGLLRASVRPNSPRVAVYFSSKYGPLRYESDRYKAGPGSLLAAWQANVRAIALSLEALRAVNRHGVSGHGEQYKGWTAIGTGTPVGGPLTEDEALTLLSRWARKPLDRHSSPEAVKWAFRKAASMTHPDVLGGDPEMFRRVTEARDLLIGVAS